MTGLPVELIGMVANVFKNGTLYCGTVETDDYNAGQEDLARLLQVSKAVHAQCLPSLYHDCLVDNFGSFAKALQNDPQHPIRLTKRLHLTHQPAPYFNLYELLFESKGGAWKHALFTAPPGETRKQADEGVKLEKEGLTSVAQVIRQRRDEGLDIFPNLKRIIFTAYAKNKVQLGFRMFATAFNTTDAAYALPLLILGRATVEHYCQKGVYGPLALPSAIIRVLSPPSTVTVHIPFNYQVRSQNSFLPVVLGATNRYIFTGNKMPNCDLDSVTDSYADELVRAALQGVLNTMKQVDQVVIGQGADGTFATCHLSKLTEIDQVVKATRIEMYGAIHWDRTIREEEQMKAKGEPISELNTSLAPFQAALDRATRGWKGPVLIKRRDETPVCAGCDYIAQEEWKMMNKHFCYA